MTKDEYARKLDALRRDGLTTVLVYLGLILAVGSALWWVSHLSTGQWSSIIQPVACLVFIAAVPAMGKRVVNSSLRKHGLLCPDCNKALTKPPVKLEGSVGRCGRCGAVIFED